jgi:hypothetical protein
VHAPDPDDAKLARIAQAREHAADDPAHLVFLYQDACIS